jgi:ribosomal protein L6P/L9E
LYGWNNFYFKKLKFTGKGYKISKSAKKKNIKFLFNRAHFTILAYKKIIFKRIKKSKFLIKSTNKEKLLKISKLSKNVRPINLYTLRGIRFSRSIVYKKASKKGVSL